MLISIVVAAAENGAIGKNNTMPWRLPDDLKHFKQVTMGKPVVMGRKTFDSIGKPLPGRHNIVLTRQADFDGMGATIVASVDDAIRAAGAASELCVIGGAELYRQILPKVRRIYLTRVHAQVDADTFFPALIAGEWRETHRQEHAIDERHALAFTFLTLERNP